MTRFGIDFKSKKLEYGAERLKTDRAYSLDTINRYCCGRDGFPPLPNVDVEGPRDLQGFNYAKTTKAEDKADLGCHFFIDDYQFERLWQRPARYLDVLKPYKCVLTPDFSLYMDMPDAMQEWNRYRSAALGWYWAQNGITVIPTLSWAQPSSYRFCFNGIPKHSTVATSTVGVARDGAGQGRSKDMARRNARGDEASRAVPRASLRKEYRI